METTTQARAMLRMAMHDESKRLSQGVANTSPAVGAEYPRMLYRKTDVEDEYVLAVDKDGKTKERIVRNLFNGLLCDTVVAESLDDAETLASDGWESSPQSAYGQVSGIARATSAKDDEIAALRAALAEANAKTDSDTGEARRGPGRPPKIDTTQA